MDWTSLLDSLVKQFTDHHDEQVLNNWRHDLSTDGTVSQQGTRVRQDQEGTDFGLAGQRFEQTNRTPTPELSKRGTGVWDVTADPYRLTKDRIKQANPGLHVPLTDTPISFPGEWDFGSKKEIPLK